MSFFFLYKQMTNLTSSHSHASQMYFSKVTVLAVISSLPAVFGTPTLRARQNNDKVSCQTSSGSPVAFFVTQAIRELRIEGGLCRQQNKRGSSKTFPRSCNHDTGDTRC